MSNNSPTYYWDPFIKKWYYFTDEGNDRIELDVENYKMGDTRRTISSSVHFDKNELVRTCPSLKPLIEYIEGISEEEQAESEVLQGEINDRFLGKERLYEICIPRAIKCGIMYSKRYSVDREDTIQNALLGACQAINTYSEGPFIEHLNRSMWEEVMKGIPIGEQVCCMPWRMKPVVRSILRETEIEHSDFPNSTDYYKYVSETVISRFHCSSQTANNLASLLVDPLDIDLLIETEDSSLSDAGLGDEELTDKAYQAQVKGAIDQAIGTLKTKRAKDIICMRFGFYGEPMTCADIGREIGLTRSRVGQIVYETLKKLRHPSRKLYLLSQKPKKKLPNKSPQNKTVRRPSGTDRKYDREKRMEERTKAIKRKGAESENVKTVTHEKKHRVKREVMEIQNEYGKRTIIFEY